MMPTYALRFHVEYSFLIEGPLYYTNLIEVRFSSGVFRFLFLRMSDESWPVRCHFQPWSVLSFRGPTPKP